MNNFLDNLKGLGRRRLILMGTTAVGLTAAMVIGLSVSMAEPYRPLVTDVSASEAAGMVSQLEQAGFAPRISTDGTVLSLPESDLARARMALAEAGLPAAGNVGWELFDQGGLGMNGFLQQVNRLRALEGELARSIETLDNVESARVHLVLPDREAFSQERPEPSSSVVIHARRGLPVEKSQAMAIRSLVAAAVPRLSPDRITILDGTGQAILSEEDTSTGNGIAALQAQTEERLRRNVESILAAHVGAENVRVRVTAELQTAREVVVQEAFDPSQQVARSTSSETSDSERSDGSSGAVDVANNLPGIDNGAGGSQRSERSSTSREQADFAIGNTRSETIREPGDIKTLSVAVVVNGTWDEDGVYSPRSPEDIARLEALVNSAAGIKETRGDTVTVENLRFVTGPGESEITARGLMDIFAANFGSIIRAFSAISVVALLLLLGVRPLLRMIGPREGEEADPAAEALASDVPVEAGGDDATPDAPAADTGSDAQANELSGDAPEEDGEDYVSLASVSGNVMRKNIEHLGNVVETDPDGSLRTIRAWINQKA